MNSKSIIGSGFFVLAVIFFSLSSLQAANIALGKTVVTSSNYNSSYTGAKAVDGTVSVASKWTSNGASANSWMYVDLGSSQSVAQVVVKHAGAAGEATYFNTQNFGIYTWNGASWVLRSNVSNNTSSITTHTFSANTRYVRLEIWDAGIDNYARIPEFEVHNSTGGGGCNIVLTTSGTSSIGWIYANSVFSSRTCGSVGAGCGTNGWNVTCSSGCGLHIDDDYYADDWIRYSGSSNVSCGENVYAPFAGTILFAGRLSYSYGRTVIIRSSQNTGFAFRVAHLQSIASGLSSGNSVTKGQYIGQVGNDDGTGNGEGSNFVCHAHAVLYKNIGTTSALNYLGGGHPPSGDIGSQTSATTYAAPYYLDAVCTSKMDDEADAEALGAAIPMPGTASILHDLEVYPHPVRNAATLSWRQDQEAPVSIRMINMMGQVVRDISAGTSYSAGMQSLDFETTGVGSGIYFLVMRSGETAVTKKVVVANE